MVNLKRSVGHFIFKATQGLEGDIMKDSIIQEIKDGVRNGSILPVDGVVVHEGKKFSVTGEKRLQVKEIKERKPRNSSKKEKKFTEPRECETCGKVFTPNKFNPYFTECPDCRKKHRLAAPLEPRKCDKCGKSFTPNKFNPYFTTCPDCRKSKPKKAKKSK